MSETKTRKKQGEKYRKREKERARKKVKEGDELVMNKRKNKE